MCGVAALISADGADPGQIEAMAGALDHRGPMGGGIVILDEGRVALGHRQLRILDRSDACLQPMTDRDGLVWIAYNGYVANHLLLRRELQAGGQSFTSETDTEVLLALYLREGIRMVRRLDGMFAFLLHDVRSRTTYYARDSLGIKPLYLRALRHGVALASEPTALRSLGPNSLDLLPVVHSLMLHYPPGAGFGIREIRRVQPGEVGAIGSDGRITRLSVEFDATPTGSFHRAASDRLHQVLTASVRDHLTSAQPVGVSFSGGVDSTLLAGLVAEQDRRDVKLFSMVPFGAVPKERLDDPARIRRVAAALGLEWVPISPPPSLVDRLTAAIRHMGEPITDFASIAALEIARAAREHGVRVLLSGHGSDELFGGYRRHVVAARILAAEPAAYAVRRLGRVLGPDFRRLAEVLRRPREQWLALMSCVVSPYALERLLAPEVRCQLGPAEQVLEPISAAHPVHGSPLDRLMYFDQRTMLPARNLNYLDKVSMGFGVEARVPYLGSPVVRYARGIRSADLVGGLTGKVPLRRVLARVLGRRAVGVASKRGFGIPVHDMMRREWKAVLERLDDGGSPTQSFWHPNVLAQLPNGGLHSQLVASMLAIDAWMRDWNLC
jgi:asparagine synthase (glutamine-hydrolysing)